jgi:hypothetical protein
VLGHADRQAPCQGDNGTGERVLDRKLPRLAWALFYPFPFSRFEFKYDF